MRLSSVAECKHSYYMRLKGTVLTISLLSVALALSAKDTSKLEVVTDDRMIAPTDAVPLVSYADVIGTAAPSVVSVYTTRIQSFAPRQSPPAMEDLLRNFSNPGQPPQDVEPRNREVTGLGSGVIISADGYIITNHHVIREDRSGPVDEIRVQLENGEEYTAEVIGTDAKTDVAVIKIDVDQALNAVTIADSELLRTGDIVFAIGSPLGQSQTVTQGIVSATERTSLDILGIPGAYENFIQTDAAINLGNSGGALIDAWGRLIGINAAIVSGTGGSIGLGYAIPSNMALRVARSLIEVGEVPRGLLGLYPVDLDADLAEAFELESTQGALVNQVQEGSPAEDAGIQHGDIIFMVDDIAIGSAAQLRLTVSQMAPGREVEVSLIRNGETLLKNVILGSVSGKPVAQQEAAPSVLEGVMLAPLDDALREQFNAPDSVSGVAVRDVAPDSPYFDKLAKEMIIMEVNKVAADQPEDIAAQLKPGSNSFYVWTLGQPRFVVLRIRE